MADFSVNASKNIPPAKSGCSVKVECDSAGENCYCPTNDNFDAEVGYKGNATDEFNPLLLPLQAVGLANVAFEAVFGDGISAPKSTPELSKPKAPTPRPDTSIDQDAYDSFSLSLTPPSFWSGSIFENFGGGDSTPEQRGQFAAQNIAANIYGGGLPSVSAVEPPAYGADFSFSTNYSSIFDGNFVNFAKE
jgi:hypothetical protein